MSPVYIPNEILGCWCTVHHRPANWVRITLEDGCDVEASAHCDPALGGIMFPCRVVWRDPSLNPTEPQNERIIFQGELKTAQEVGK